MLPLMLIRPPGRDECATKIVEGIESRLTFLAPRTHIITQPSAIIIIIVVHYLLTTVVI